MIALLGREFVNLPLLCGVAGRSRDSSGPPARGAFSLRWFTVCQGAASICVCPFFLFPIESAPCASSGPRLSRPTRCPLLLSLHLSDQCPGTLHLGQSLSGPLLTACSQKRVLGPGVVWWHSPGTPPPSHCPPTKPPRCGQSLFGKKSVKTLQKTKDKRKEKRINYCCTCSQIIKM